MKKIYHIYAYINVIIILTGALYFLYSFYVDGTYVRVPLVMNVDSLNLKVDRPFYKPGDRVSVQTAFCKNYSYVSQTSWNLVNSIIRPFPERTYNVPAGCVGLTWFPIITIPTDEAFIGVANYYLEGETKVQVNPFHSVVYHFKTEPFRILPNI